MSIYKGAASEGSRAAALLKKREIQKEELELRKAKIAKDMERASANIDSKFATISDDLEAELRSMTYGLVTLEQMKAQREELEAERERRILDAANKASEVKVKEKKPAARVVVSFDVQDDVEEDDDDEDNVEEESRSITEPPAKPSTPPSKKRRFGMNPDVDTSFLPDRDREEQDRRERERLRQEWETKQKTMKQEEIEITYSYWDGSGHRRAIKMKKGDTIQGFLNGCLRDLRSEFPELRAVNVDNLMYVKEDLIIPHHKTFYEFIIKKVRGKSGPLFSFDVHDDVRLQMDSTVEKDESHAGKVCLRSWYERNKHIFPASRWEPYDEEKIFTKYTIADNVNA